MSLRSDPINFGESWPPIEKLLLDILHQRYNEISNETWQKTFFDVYKICVAPEYLVGILYSRLKDLLQTHVQILCGLVSSVDTQNLLSSYHNYWLTYKSAAEYLDKLFSYLNTQHLRRTKKPMQSETDQVCHPGLEVKNLCFYLWEQDMITPLKEQMVYLLMKEIELDRKGMNVNQSIISGVIHSLAEIEEYNKEDTLALYRNAFEKPFLAATGEYYKLEAEKYRSELNCSSYMKKVLQLIDLETLRCTKFIHNSSKDKVISEIRARMVADHSKFLHQESEQMVASNCWQDLQAMYKLLKPIEGGLKTLIQQVQSRITQIGLETIKQVTTSNNPPKAFVESFIQVYKKHLDLIGNIFNSDQLFVSALDKACAAIINHRLNPQQPCRSPELLAKYCDCLLRKPSSSSNQGTTISKNLTESEIDEKLSLSIIVFKYIDDKDIFQKFYAKNLARRLIFSQLASMEAEESMINKLKQVCGYEFTAKLQRMFTGIGVSNEQREKFNQYLRKNNLELGISFSIYILQVGSWPLGQSPITNFALPSIFEKSVKAFEEYYYSTFNGRVLTWLYHHCTADLKLCYTPKKQYFVSMQTFHAAILLLFENADELTYDEISKATKLSDDQLSKYLQGLLESRILILADELYSDFTQAQTTVQPSTSAITESMDASHTACLVKQKSEDGNQTSHQQYNFTPETKIRLNLEFSSRRTKFKIAVVQRDTQYQQAREQSDSDHTHSSIDEDRKLYIQAAIVRVMKSRRFAKHNQLIQEVIGLTKGHFSPSVTMIKKCIEILIEKQYLERGTDAADEYKYIA